MIMISWIVGLLKTFQSNYFLTTLFIKALTKISQKLFIILSGNKLSSKNGNSNSAVARGPLLSPAFREGAASGSPACALPGCLQSSVLEGEFQ